ncbi:MAG: SMC family ATPase [Dehalococcoidia bacterium]
MLPISLTVRNFLSYREAAPTLHLEDVHVACLCGPNGYGKSALLDAITWVLWGRARGQRTEQLLHHGQDEMSVELEFDVRDERYKAMRRYSKARKNAQSSLELSVLTGNDYRPITGDTIRATEEHITRLINMDYDTFVNSAFLVQGRADLFTMSTPTQRKEVLAKVLGLGLYDRLEARAKLHRGEVEAQLSASSFELERLRERVGQADEVRERLEATAGALSAAQQSATSLAERLELIRKQLSTLEQRRAESAELAAGIERTSARREEAGKEALDIEGRTAEWRRSIERAPEIEAGIAALEVAREQFMSLNAAARKLNALRAELAPVEQRVTEVRAGLDRDVKALGHRIETELMPKAQSLSAVDESLAGIEAQRLAIDAQSVEAAERGREQQALTLEARKLEHENASLTERGRETNSKLALLEHDHEEGVTCPLCGSELEGDALERIKATFEQELEQQRTLFKEQLTRVTALDAKADEVTQLHATLQSHVEETRRRLDAERARLTVEHDGAMRAGQELAEARHAVAEAKVLLETGAYATEEQTLAASLKAQMGELAFDSHAVDIAERSAKDLAHWEAEHAVLAQAKARLPDDEAALERARARVVDAEQEAARLEARRAAIAQELSELPGFQAQERQVAVELGEASKKRDELQSATGALKVQMEEIATAETELKEREASQKGMAHEAAVYGELALAFGKGGVQALLIEAAIPRLEDEANDLLKQMTDGRMSLKLETQRARRTGRGADGSDSVETLDIVIADELGTRSYDMFSGGERFRVDFALRIALSKVLAWRAGAPLPTLFIDEGFGTQDAQGRDRILDVIKAIEDRFQRILVITHLDEIKEAFPVRIEVTRDAAGSSFSMS